MLLDSLPLCGEAPRVPNSCVTQAGFLSLRRGTGRRVRPHVRDVAAGMHAGHTHPSHRAWPDFLCLKSGRLVPATSARLSYQSPGFWYRSRHSSCRRARERADA